MKKILSLVLCVLMVVMLCNPVTVSSAGLEYLVICGKVTNEKNEPVHVLNENDTPVPRGVPAWISYTSPTDSGNWPWNTPISLEEFTMTESPDTPVWPADSYIDVLAVGRTGAVLEWSKATIIDENCEIQEYRIFNQGQVVAVIPIDYIYGDANVNRFPITELAPSTDYIFSVQAISNTFMTSELLSMDMPVTTLPPYDVDDKVIRVSVNSDGVEGVFLGEYESYWTPDSYDAEISADGRYIAFTSYADNFHPADYNKAEDVFLYDRLTGVTKCLSVTPDGKTGNYGSYSPAISADGRYVAFLSFANNLVPDVDDNDMGDLYLYDTLTDTLELVSIGTDGTAAGFTDYSRPAVSEDGRYIAFSSESGNLTNDIYDGKQYIYIRDRESQTTTRIDYPTAPGGVVEGAFNPSISFDGSVIAFEAWVFFDEYVNDNFTYVYLPETDTFELISKRYENEQEVPVTGAYPDISGDGRFVIFSTNEIPLVDEDTNTFDDIYVYDRVERKMVLVSVDSEGNAGNNNSDAAAISADGRFVVFSSLASNLVPNDNNNAYDVFVRDLVNNTTERVSVAADGTEADVGYNYLSGYVDISGNGRYVAFESYASNLVPYDNNDSYDVFVYDRGSEETPITVPSVPQGFTATPGDSQVELSWSAPSDDGGSAITRYEVSSDAGASWTDVGLNTTYVFTGLTNDTEYTFKVRAFNAVGNSDAATVTATPVAEPVPTYTVTVNNGTGSGQYEQDATVDITADTPPAGQRFKEWQVVSGGITLENPNEPVTSFLMPANPVEITAVYEDIPAATYTVTVNGSYADTTGAGSYEEGETVTIHAGSRQNYSFDGWTSEDGVTFADASSATTTFVMPGKAVTVTANWKSSGDTPSVPVSPPVTPLYRAGLKFESGLERSLPLTVNMSTGTAVTDLGAQETGEEDLLLTMPSIPNVYTYSLDIPVADLKKDTTERTITVTTNVGSIVIPSNMLTGIPNTDGSKARITIGQGDKSTLPEDVRERIGDRPLINLSLSVDGKQTEWNNPNAPVTVSIPYTPTPEELANPDSIVVWYIDGAGNVVTVTNGRYDSVTGTVTFTVDHFSHYAVAYNRVKFSDVAENAWYHDAVSFMAARGITLGTGDGKFNPNGKLTRGQFLVILMRAYGIEPDENPKDNFADAGDTYYTSYLAMAKRLKIVDGIGNNLFAPDKEITRQEMFVMMYNALKILGQLPQENTGKSLYAFSDASDVASWAKEAVTSFVKAGIIRGHEGKINPKGTSTRAEAAQVIYNLLAK
jgi:uncharacterized repeat protein (TIGR02543 family)